MLEYLTRITIAPLCVVERPAKYLEPRDRIRRTGFQISRDDHFDGMVHEQSLLQVEILLRALMVAARI